VAHGQADPQAELVAAPAPAARQLREPIAYLDRRFDGDALVVIEPARVIEEAISPSPAKCSTVPPLRTTISPTAAWYSRSTLSTSSGSADSANA